jgi:hypothetical protein
MSTFFNKNPPAPWATEAALGVTMFSYNLMSVLRHAVLRQKVHHTLSTLHHQVLAVGALWDDSTKNTKQTFRLAAHETTTVVLRLMGQSGGASQADGDAVKILMSNLG